MTEIPAFIRNPKRARPYAHFDCKCSFVSKAHLIMDEKFVSSYAFYPLIEKSLRRMKQDGKGNLVNKPRPIRYAAHLDRCIYQYYAGLLNELYNVMAAAERFDGAAIAYRSNKRGQSNCTFAMRAFSFIRSLDRCYVYAGDFKDFFETLDHKYLKQQVRRLFADRRIPDDYYHVVKNSMCYSVWKIEKLLDYHGLHHTKAGVRKLNRMTRVLEPNEFKTLVKKKGTIEQPWRKSGCGVPQGLPTSGVLANIYMMEFDQKLSEHASETGGLYMRYSDDFIFVAPTEEGLRDVMAEIANLSATVPGVKLHPDKTRAFSVKNGKVNQLPIGQGATIDRLATHIDYLGFTFDGCKVRMRQRTVGRFYRRMYHRIKQLYEHEKPSKRRVEGLYIDFSDWGSDPRRNRKVRKLVGKENRHGNFITYAHRAQRAFPSDDVLVDVSRHKHKIRKRSERVLGGESPPGE